MAHDTRKPVFGGFAYNKGADQPAHQRSLINAFAIHLLESIISSIAKSEISIFWLASICSYACWFESPRRQGFSRCGSIKRYCLNQTSLNLRLVSEFVFITILLLPNVTCGSAVAQFMVECLTRDRGLRVRASSAALRYVIEQDTLVLAAYWFNPGRPVRT